MSTQGIQGMNSKETGKRELSSVMGRQGREESGEMRQRGTVKMNEIHMIHSYNHTITIVVSCTHTAAIGENCHHSHKV